MFISLFLIWLIFNGKMTLEIFFLGIIISAVLTKMISKIMGIHRMKSKTILKNFFWGTGYVLSLIVEVIKANIHLIKIVLSPRIDLNPQLVYFSIDLKYNWARVLLANSITLTPGTLTISLEENKYCVHAMDKDMAEGIDSSIFVKILKKMEEVNSEEHLNMEERMEV